MRGASPRQTTSPLVLTILLMGIPILLFDTQPFLAGSLLILDTSYMVPPVLHYLPVPSKSISLFSLSNRLSGIL